MWGRVCILGFVQSFRSWVKTMYNGISVMNGGFSTGYCYIKRRVRQGDPLVPVLLVMEILAHALGNDLVIKAIEFSNFEVRQILYADEMNLFVNSGTSVTRIQDISRAFYKSSGLKVNKEQTNVMRIENTAKSRAHYL